MMDVQNTGWKAERGLHRVYVERERFSSAIRKGWASNGLSDAVWLIIPQRKNTNAKKPTSL